MIKQPTTLADGRELIYFDDGLDRTPSDGPPEDRASIKDERELDERAPGSTLRWDPLMSEWVAIASHRQTRTFLPPADQCPLCPSRPGRPSEIPAHGYDVVAFENRFPSFAREAPTPDADPDPQRTLFAQRPGFGRCEVLCFTSDHDTSFAQLPLGRVRTVVEAWADRTAELSAIDGIEQVFCFENRGEEIGVTLHHPHGQIYGYPFIPPRSRRILESAREYAERTGGNLFDDLVAAERTTGGRVLVENEHWIGFVPGAARWPVEAHLFPKRRVPDFAALTDDEKDALGPAYLPILRAFDRLYDQPAPYIAGWFQAPARPGADRDMSTLHLQLFSIRRESNKLKYVAGSESAMGVWINDLTPEQIADRLRAVWP